MEPRDGNAGHDDHRDINRPLDGHGARNRRVDTLVGQVNVGPPQLLADLATLVTP